MKFSSHEKDLLLLCAVAAPGGEPLNGHDLQRFFARDAHYERARDSLARWQLILFDRYQNVVRYNRAAVFRALVELSGQKRTAELFTMERPLDALLAQSSHMPMRAKPEGSQSMPHVPMSFSSGLAQMRAAANGESPPGLFARESVSKAQPHEHGRPCNSGNTWKLHEHEAREVGELEPRCWADIERDMRKLRDGRGRLLELTQENWERWQKRFEWENAGAVNAVVREAQMRQRHIGNLGGWLNRTYLKAVGVARA